MRGKVETWIMIIAISRITPAYAGKSHTGIVAVVEMKGSPPPMRGKVLPMQIS